MKRNQLVSDMMSTSHGNSIGNHSGTMLVNVGGPVNMLSTNKDSSMVVVCGRTVLKMYSVEETCFSEKLNMRVGRRQGLNLSCADVAWNHINENIIATAATNGHIVVWDLNLTCRNKQVAEFLDHNRTVNRINFHNSEPGRLLSGSQDCTMKMFDVRKKTCVSSFASKNDGVRCVQFCPHEYFHFAASFDNGSVQLWDYRNTSTYLMQFIAHKGSVYSVEWHPDVKDKNRIATGGRDNKIKVWDMYDNAMYEHLVIPTHSLVAMARWRPQRRDQIASVAMMLDHSINVWDIRRPFVPFAHFTEHTDVTTGIVWKNGDPGVLFSCSKDGTLYQHSIRDAARPSEHCNLSGLSIAPRGFLAYASTDNSSLVDLPPSNRRLTMFGFRSGVVTPLKLDSAFSNPPLPHGVNAKLAKFLNSKSDFAVHLSKSKSESLRPTNLVDAAKLYKLNGLLFGDLCEYNAAVAERLGMFTDMQVWKHIKVLYGGVIPNKAERSNSSSFHSGSLEKNNMKSGKEAHKNGALTNESNGEDSEQHSDPETEHYLTDIARGNATSEQDCYYSEDEDMLVEHFNSNMVPSDGNSNWLPSEAIQRRLVYQSTDGPETTADSNISMEEGRIITASPITIPDSSLNVSGFDHVEHSRKRNIRKSTSSGAAHQSPPTIATSPISPIVYINPIQMPYLLLNQKAKLLENMLEDILNNYSNGIQIVACAILILSHYCPSLQLSIPHDRIEYWQSAYLNIVSKFELWNHYAEILKLSNIPTINGMNAACVVHSSCMLCDKRLTSKSRWICPKHKDADHKSVGLGSGIKCAVCHMIINGLYTWCQGCGHGGHTKCMEEWFEFPPSQGRCPTGCGHICTRCL